MDWTSVDERVTASRRPKEALHPHTMRHSTAIAMLTTGVDLSTTAIWLGHEGVSTTHKYMVADMEMKERAGTVG